MHTLVMSYELSQKYRLVARTAPEVYYNLNELITRFAARDSVQFRGRKLGVEAALNSIVLHWLAMPEDEQLRVIREGVGRFERLLEGGPEHDAEPGARKKPAPQAGLKHPADGFTVNELPPTVPTRRGGKHGPKRGPKAG